MKVTLQLLFLAALCLLAVSGISLGQSNPEKIRVILDTDANNELDDQHAIAYLLFNGDVFDVEAITVNRTRNGGGVDQHLAEAQRVVELCGLDGQIPVLRGADKSFEEIKGQLDRPDFDGAEAVNFIIERAKAADSHRLVLLPVGKLTNIALALAKAPSIIPKVRVVWLGSNYPDPGEYNQVNDEPSLNYILDTGVDFEIAIVRYGKPSGTDAVRATLDEIRKIMPGKGPKVSPPVTGRHGGEFSCFGDYAVSLFKNINLHGDPPSRALFDMAAVAIVKNPAWARAVEIPAPILKDGRWVDRPDNPRKIILWENFDRDAIMADFYDRMQNYQLASLPLDVRRIQPWSQDRRYWQYKGQPVLLLGGSWQDNLFNHPKGLEKHLDVLKSAGGNYLRNVMSHRNVGNVFAYEQVDGKFNLDRWNDEYWRRFESFLKLTGERDIIVQIEIWATWDHYNDHQSIGGWSKHPFNPVNNVNYTAEGSGLPVAIDHGAAATPTGHKFFHTVPALENNAVVLCYQRAYVDKLLSYSLKYPHVLYCMNNETGEPVAWSDFWARYVRAQAAEAGKRVEVAEMRRHHDITAPDHRHMIDHPDLYSFLDISQNNTQGGHTHWDRMLQVRAMVQDRPRPINNNKIYSGGNDEEAVARMFRILFAGGASARFHRPHPLEGTDDHEKSTGWGLGLSPRAQATLRAARTLTEAMNVFACQPQNDLLSERSSNEAYCLAEPGRQYTVYFPDGGGVDLDLSGVSGSFVLAWLDIENGRWQPETTVEGGRRVKLAAPGQGHWVVLVNRARDR